MKLVLIRHEIGWWKVIGIVYCPTNIWYRSRETNGEKWYVSCRGTIMKLNTTQAYCFFDHVESYYIDDIIIKMTALLVNTVDWYMKKILSKIDSYWSEKLINSGKAATMCRPQKRVPLLWGNTYSFGNTLTMVFFNHLFTYWVNAVT